MTDDNDDATSPTDERKGPRRGSAASTQRRGVGGKFRGRRVRIRKPRKSRIGIRGPSYMARRSHRWLVRQLVIVEHMVGRLEAERDGRTWNDPVRAERSNMGGIRDLQQRNVAENVAALREVLDQLAGRREDKRDREEVAAAVRKMTGKNFSVRQLYRKPYDTMFRDKDPVDVVGLHPADNAAQANDRAMIAKHGLIYHIRRQHRLLKVLLEQRRATLLAQSVAEDWKPLVVRKASRAGGLVRGAGSAVAANDLEAVDAASVVPLHAVQARPGRPA